MKYIYWNTYNSPSGIKEEALETMLRSWLGEQELDEQTKLDTLDKIEIVA